MQIFEDNPSYKLSATSITQDYNVIEAGTMTGFQVKTAVLGFAPVTNTQPGSAYAWPRRSLSLEEKGGGVWKASVTWSSLSYQYATEIGGSQQQIRCDKSVIHAYPNAALGVAGNIPDELAVGKTGAPVGFDGRTVHGASIYIPTRTWTESVEIPVTQYSFDYEDAVAAINAAPVNQNEFRGYPAGDILFQGMNASLSTQNPDFVTASFKFAQSYGNRAGDESGLPLLNIGGIADIAKDGWDYLDVRYQPQVATAAPTLQPAAQYVIIHRVYDRSDFAPLNIGTGQSLPLWQG